MCSSAYAVDHALPPAAGGGEWVGVLFTGRVTGRKMLICDMSAFFTAETLDGWHSARPAPARICTHLHPHTADLSPLVLAGAADSAAPGRGSAKGPCPRGVPTFALAAESFPRLLVLVFGRGDVSVEELLFNVRDGPAAATCPINKTQMAAGRPRGVEGGGQRNARGLRVAGPCGRFYRPLRCCSRPRC